MGLLSPFFPLMQVFLGKSAGQVRVSEVEVDLPCSKVIRVCNVNVKSCV